jgi:aminoglycoside phosphotransferase family enzyme/predicted kinase
MCSPAVLACCAEQGRLVGALAAQQALRSGGSNVRVIETHISYVLLTGTFAYKIKKAVDFGFLNFTTLAARKHFCEQELRLNRRLAPALYLDVVAITGSAERPEIGGEGPALDYAVKMREFPQSALASGLLANNALGPADIDALAAQVAAFHETIGVAADDGAFGSPEAIRETAMQNIASLRGLSTSPREQRDIDDLAAWTEHEYLAKEAALRGRQRGGFVRECHGDLHLGNIARVDGKLTVFDCIEFNDEMRWIDVMSEVAFTVMDLEDRNRRDLARRFLNGYLEITGDYAGLAVLPFYLAYRALVRAKIHRLRAAQLGTSAQATPLAEYRGYIALALRYTQPRHAAVVLTHGLSGSGKTVLSQALLEQTDAVRIRSDVERKRLHRIAPQERFGAGIERGVYSSASTVATYRRMCALASDIAAAGFVAIVDATFLHRWQRDLFQALAANMRVPFLIVSFQAPEPTLRQRIARRLADGKDASDANLDVLEHQLRTQEPLAAEETANVVEYQAGNSIESARTPEAWGRVLERIGDAGARNAP